MATVIKPKRSSVTGKLPKGENLEVGEIALNLADKKLYTKQADGTIIAISDHTEADYALDDLSNVGTLPTSVADQLKGQKGEVGQKGQKGQGGQKGQTGQKGQKGQTGADSEVAGPKGQKGQTGADSTVQGPKGQKGQEGASVKGQKGQTGADSTVAGPKGQKGQTGADSTVQGPKGQKGQTGAASTVEGPKGQKGQTGADSTVEGPKGEKGQTGQKGQKGQTGADSTVEGPKGQKGQTGADSTVQGPKGQKGQTGASVKGQKGDTGTKGQKGQTGASVKGQKGDTGTKGQKGQKGDFASVTGSNNDAVFKTGTDTLEAKSLLQANSGYTELTVNDTLWAKAASDGDVAIKLGQLSDNSSQALYTVTPNDAVGDRLTFATTRWSAAYRYDRGSAAGGGVAMARLNTTTDGDVRGASWSLHKQADSSASGSTTTTTDINLNTAGNSYFNTDYNFGIGTSTPSTAVHFYHPTDDTVLTVESGNGQSRINLTDSSGTARIGGSSSDLRLEADPSGTVANSSIDFRIDGAEVAKFSDDGYLGVNVTSPAYHVDVDGNINLADSNTIRFGGTRFASESNLYHNLCGADGNIAIYLGGVTDNRNYYQANAHRFRNDGDTQNFGEWNSTGLGVGTLSPETELHVTDGVNAGIKTTYADLIVEATDAQMDLTSTSSGSWGSAINFVEGDTTTNTDVWSIARQTTGGTGDSSLRFNFGTTNSHNNSNKVLIDTDGNLTVTGFLTGATPASPGITSATVVNETVELVITQSSDTEVTAYEVWSDGGTGDFALVAHIPEADVAASMSVIDTSFDTGGTINYRVYAIANGVYSTAATTSASFTIPTLDVSNLQVVANLETFTINYDLPDSRFMDHIEIYYDAEADSANLTRTGATLAYSGSRDSFTYAIATADMDKYHQFWVEVVEVS